MRAYLDEGQSPIDYNALNRRRNRRVNPQTDRNETLMLELGGSLTRYNTSMMPHRADRDEVNDIDTHVNELKVQYEGPDVVTYSALTGVTYGPMTTRYLSTFENPPLNALQTAEFDEVSREAMYARNFQPGQNTGSFPATGKELPQFEDEPAIVVGAMPVTTEGDIYSVPRELLEVNYSLSIDNMDIDPNTIEKTSFLHSRVEAAEGDYLHHRDVVAADENKPPALVRITLHNEVSLHRLRLLTRTHDSVDTSREETSLSKRHRAMRLGGPHPINELEGLLRSTKHLSNSDEDRPALEATKAALIKILDVAKIPKAGFERVSDFNDAKGPYSVKESKGLSITRPSSDTSIEELIGSFDVRGSDVRLAMVCHRLTDLTTAPSEGMPTYHITKIITNIATSVRPLKVVRQSVNRWAKEPGTGAVRRAGGGVLLQPIPGCIMVDNPIDMMSEMVERPDAADASLARAESTGLNRLHVEGGRIDEDGVRKKLRPFELFNLTKRLMMHDAWTGMPYHCGHDKGGGKRDTAGLCKIRRQKEMAMYTPYGPGNMPIRINMVPSHLPHRFNVVKYSGIEISDIVELENAEDKARVPYSNRHTSKHFRMFVNDVAKELAETAVDGEQNVIEVCKLVEDYLFMTLANSVVTGKNRMVYEAHSLLRNSDSTDDGNWRERWAKCLCSRMFLATRVSIGRVRSGGTVRLVTEIPERLLKVTLDPFSLSNKGLKIWPIYPTAVGFFKEKVNALHNPEDDLTAFSGLTVTKWYKRNRGFGNDLPAVHHPIGLTRAPLIRVGTGADSIANVMRGRASPRWTHAFSVDDQYFSLDAIIADTYDILRSSLGGRPHITGVIRTTDFVIALTATAVGRGEVSVMFGPRVSRVMPKRSSEDSNRLNRDEDSSYIFDSFNIRTNFVGDRAGGGRR
jgi:hypothetical protein